MEELTSYLSDLNCRKETYYFLGDSNIDFANVNSSTAIADLLNSLSCSGGLSLINIPTRITKSSATIMDHIFTSDVSHSVHAGVIRSDLFDHFPIFCKVSDAGLLLTQQRNATISNSDYTETNLDLVVKILMKSWSLSWRCTLRMNLC